MSYIPLKINGKQLCEIFTPEAVTDMSDEERRAYSLAHEMYPTTVALTSETYSRNADRTADYELRDLLIVNRKASPAFTWELLRQEYVQRLLQFLDYDYNFKDENDVVQPREAEPISVTYLDLIGERTIDAYLGQTIEGTMEEYDGILYVRNFRIAFPER